MVGAAVYVATIWGKVGVWRRRRRRRRRRKGD
jgi:hypothetical protein